MALNIVAPKPNINREEFKALREIREEKPCVILTDIKGLVMEVPDRQDYITRVENLLEQQGT